jgi:xeroderma pigmentosum group C-complementing protein
VPDVYREMLAAARAEMSAHDPVVSQRPLKRKRPGEGRPARAEPPTATATAARSGDFSNRNPETMVSDDGSDDDLVEFEDVAVPKPAVQTILRESDDEEDDEDDDEIDFEDVAIVPVSSSAAGAVGGPQGLNLDLSSHMASMAPRRASRRKAISKDEKERRILVHKMHLACLLAHVELRNRWCNDRDVQDALRPLLPQKTVAALIPRASLNQFGAPSR